MNKMTNRPLSLSWTRLTLLLGVMVAVLGVGIGATQVSAQEDLTEAQTQRIQANCQSIKATLNQLHISDALLRVNRGQFYESLAGKLMDRFNTRLGNNDINTTQFVALTNSYRATLNLFRSDYQAYEQQLSRTIAIDCTKRPAEFHAAVVSAREKRSKVHDAVLKLNQYISDYKTAVDTFAVGYDQATGGRHE